MNKGTITTVNFKSEWKNPKGGIIYYHDVTIDGNTYNIGAQAKMPDFLAPGKELFYEVTDEKAKKIKRVKPPEFDSPLPSEGNKTGGKFNSRGMAVGNALTNATLLVCHGKVDIKDIEKTAKRLLDISEGLLNGDAQ